MSLFNNLSLVELGGEGFADTLTKGLFDEAAGITAIRASETFGSDRGFALGIDENFNGLCHAAPPLTWMVSLIEPSTSCCSMT